eukprot:CAMPEP_0185739434 /NCGR_PEP_ID=MMETSP1171-20130828/35438_1 /TAXON_ID=374046 /ORGANISM="Helicotheca tamensis, Strain CCMP826" /LENGTH=363 /DNA_ID=CAMNT_0028411003 /DNA_START=92 /DNA_END=1183 /DNA_ORIENTATION=-
MKQQVRLTLWDFDDIGSLPDAALAIPLEKARVSVEEATPREVSMIVHSCLRDLSISATPRRNKLLAESLDQVQFFIWLYKEKHGTDFRILIELQRSKGDSFIFFEISRIILHTLKCRGNVEVESSEIISSTHQPERLYNEASFEFPQTERTEDMGAIMYTIVEMMKEKRVDANLLGLQKLYSSTRGGSGASIHLAGAVLQGGACDCDFLQTSIERYIYRNHKGNTRNDFEIKVYRAMHFYALAVLANSLCIWSAHTMNMQQIIHSQRWLGDDGLLFALISELSEVEIYPHNSYQAMRCLNILLRHSMKVRQRTLDLGAASLVSLSQCTGHSSHALLAKESDAVMNILAGALSKPTSISRHHSI